MEIFQQSADNDGAPAEEEGGHALLTRCPSTHRLLPADAHHNVTLFDVADDRSGLVPARSLVSHDNEILDVAHVDADTVAVATNGPRIRLALSKTFVRVADLRGHENMVLCLDAVHHGDGGGGASWLVSAGKDRTVQM